MNVETARQTATTLGVSERTVRRWIASGVLPAQKAGGMFLIDPEDAQAAFAQSRAAHAGKQAEWRGRYLEVKERLEKAEVELAESDHAIRRANTRLIQQRRRLQELEEDRGRTRKEVDVSAESDWEICPICKGDEGHMEGEEWVNCPHCDGSGGWPKPRVHQNIAPCMCSVTADKDGARIDRSACPIHGKSKAK